MDEKKEKPGILGWFAGNHVAANLLMFLIIAAGLMAVWNSKKEVFPELNLDMVSISVPYRGASPEDVEEGVCLRVEESVGSVDGIKRMTSSAFEGGGSTILEVEEYADVTDVLDDVKSGVDTIITFPQETEKPIISELISRVKVISVVVYGDVSERNLRKYAERIRDDLTAIRGISQASISGVRPYEISIEVSEENLRRYNLSFDQVSRAVRKSSIDIPAGSVKTSGGEILVRTKGQKYHGSEFEDIVVLTRNDGTSVTIGDIATVRDDFEDVDLYARFDGERAAQVLVSRTGDEDALYIAKQVKEYIEQQRPQLPEGMLLSIWQDDSNVLRARMDLLIRNARIGLILVFLCLSLFLDLRLAFWTTLGIPISFLGAFYIIPMFGVTINMISLFAFIMSLGIVVDDAIVVGENIFAHRQAGMDGLSAAVKGVKEMAMPVILAVLTTQFAFLPLAYTTGIMGKIMRVLPIVVVSVLLISLIEALLILPAHLSSSKITANGGLSLRAIISKSIRKRGAVFGFILWPFDCVLSVIRKRGTGFARVFWPTDCVFGVFSYISRSTEKRLMWFVEGPFAWFVDKVIRYRYVTVTAALSVLICTAGYIIGGHIKFTFFDTVEADNMIATLTMPLGTPVESTVSVVERIEAAAVRAIEEFDQEQCEDLPSLMKHIATTVGSHPAVAHAGPVQVDIGASAQSHLAEINIELLGSEDRGDVRSVEIKNRWRELVGDVPGVSKLTFMAEFMSAGNAIELELSHEDFDVLLTASDELKAVLREYAGVSDIADDFEPGKAELKLKLKPTGRNLGLTLADLATQVRQGFYGDEAQRVQRGRDDIRVMVRYPVSERQSLGDIENMRVRLPDGAEIPFSAVADIEYGRGYATIKRVDRRRVVSVSADVDEDVANAGEINSELWDQVMPRLTREYPGLRYRFAGEQRERNDSLGSLKINFAIALMAIYGLLAVQFKSYFQPLIVMSAIPIGISTRSSLTAPLAGSAPSC